MGLEQDILRVINHTQLGGQVEITLECLSAGFPSMVIDGIVWEPEDRLMEKIVGSAYEWYYWIVREKGTVVFRRLSKVLDDGRRTYVSPDRRKYFNFDGEFYSPIVSDKNKNNVP